LLLGVRVALRPPSSAATAATAVSPLIAPTVTVAVAVTFIVRIRIAIAGCGSCAGACPSPDTAPAVGFVVIILVEFVAIAGQQSAPRGCSGRRTGIMPV
jgi:hypothetical protein